MADGSSALWFGAPNFRVLSMVDDGHELTVEVESTLTVVGCTACGTRAKAKDRRWVGLCDAPSGDRAIVLRVRRRIWSCPDADCPAKTWTERCPLAEPRRVLTTRAAEWATDRIAAIEGTVASIARGFGVSWPTVWTATERCAAERLTGDDAVTDTTQVGFDETVMQPAARLRRRRFVSVVVDVIHHRILDVFEGRDRADLDRWLASQPAEWRAGIEVVSIDPHEGYRSAIRNSLWLTDVTVVVDPFHVVRLANQAITLCRQRVQQEQLGHRGWASDPLYAIRKLLLLGAERLDDEARERIHDALHEGDPDDELADAWTAKEKVRDVYLTDDPVLAEAALDDAYAWCTAPESGPELRRLAKTRRRCAGCITVSSRPTIGVSPTRSASSTRSVAARSTADQTVGHDTPNPRAIDAIVPSTAQIRSVAQATARWVSTRRGPASSHASAQVFVGQSESGHDQVRRRTRNTIARSPDGASRSPTHRRSFAFARVPHTTQPVTVTVDSTEIVNSWPSSTTSSTLKLSAPNQSALLPSATRGLLDLGPSEVTRLLEALLLSVDPHHPARPRFSA